MSTISGISSASSAWSEMSSTRASARADKMFSKVDADGSGSVDTSELQSMLDDISTHTGNTLGRADEVLKKMDSDGSGSLSKDELDTGMKSLMPPPSSTVDFAQRSGPPPEGGPPPSSGAESGSRSSSTTDPLDSNGDGVVSAQESAAGKLKEAMKALFSAVADTINSSTSSAPSISVSA